MRDVSGKLKIIYCPQLHNGTTFPSAHSGDVSILPEMTGRHWLIISPGHEMGTLPRKDKTLPYVRFIKSSIKWRHAYIFYM